MDILGVNENKPARGEKPAQGDKPARGEKPAQGEKKAEAFRYRCTEDCTFTGGFRRKGDVISLAEKKEVPHFEPVTGE